jgi:predicted HTH transcriptional regulator
MPPPPDRERIETGELVVDVGLDFKQKVELTSECDKAKLINAVVAFLNRGPGYLVIGVAEERGRYRHFEPVREDPDAFGRQLLSVIQDNIDPRPLRVDVT